MAKVTKCNLNHTASSRKTCFNLHLPGLKSSKSFIHADIFRSKNSDKFKYIILIWRQAKVASEFFRDSASSKRILIQAVTDPLSFLANCRCTRMKLITQALQVAEAFYRYIYICPEHPTTINVQDCCSKNAIGCLAHQRGRKIQSHASWTFDVRIHTRKSVNIMQIFLELSKTRELKHHCHNGLMSDRMFCGHFKSHWLFVHFEFQPKFFRHRFVI